MRKFQIKGSSRRKGTKKLASIAARQLEADFVSKLFKIIEPPEEKKKEYSKPRR